MKCLTCNTENPDGANFCCRCGQKLTTYCLHCSPGNSPGFTYCGNCGRNIAPADVPNCSHEQFLENNLLQTQPYLPGELIRNILSKKSGPKSERKQVTIMFCDMSGFTALSAKAGPDKSFQLINDVYNILVDKVLSYQGIVNEFRGDGILAFFGAPIALEDAPQRAVRAALSIHREIARLNQTELVSSQFAPILLRIGVNTGPVVVGTVGNDLGVKYTAIGDTINIASRIESITPPGSTCISAQTFRLIEGFFRCESLGFKRIKGKTEPIEVYSVISPNNRRTRFDVNAERGLTPFSGREYELLKITEAFERVKSRSGQAFFIVSDAGMGKSRLLYEFRKKVGSEDIIFIEGKCLSYSSQTPYYLIIDILKSVFNLNQSDDDDLKTKKVKKIFTMLSSEYQSSLPYILEFLSIEAQEYSPLLQVSPEAKKDKILEVLKEMVVKGAEDRPLILACEDLHWMDKNSGDALRHIMQTIADLPVLLIFTFRHEFKRPWTAQENHNTVTLSRLSEKDNLVMIKNLLENEKLDQNLEKLIQEKTEGIPFFTEEFVKSLKELDIIRNNNGIYHLVREKDCLTIPSTIHDVIMARVDSLPAETKEILQIGSAIEREFEFQLVKNVSGCNDEELLSHFALLRDSNLVYEYGEGASQNSLYIFKHALTREVLYDSISIPRKTSLHNKIGHAIELLHKDNIGEYYAILSHHYSMGEHLEKAAEFSRLAGKQAQKRSAYKDAIAFGKKCFGCLEQLPQAEDLQKKIIDARTSTSNYCMGINHHFDGMQVVSPIIELAHKIKYKEKFPQILLTTGSYKVFSEENFEEGIADLIKAKDLALEYLDSLTYWYSTFFLGSIYYVEAEFEKSRALYEQSLFQSEKKKSVSGICFSICSMAAWPFGHSGKLDISYRQSKKALALSMESGDIFIQQATHAAFGYCCYMIGLFPEAKKHLHKANQLYEKAGNTFWGALGQLWLGEYYLALGDLKNAEVFFTQSENTMESRRVLPSWSILTQTKILQCKSYNKPKKIDLEKLRRSAEWNRIKVNEGAIANGIADILINSGKGYYEEAEKWINKAITVNRRHGINWRLAGDYALYHTLLVKCNDMLKAEEQLSIATRLYKQFGSNGWIEKCKKELPVVA